MKPDRKKTLTRLPLIMIFATMSLHLFAQSPQGFNYQAIARDGSGNPIVNNSTLQAKIAVLSDTVLNTVVWEELFNPVKTNAFGMFTLVIGKGTRQVTSAVANFSDINWNVPNLFIKTQIYYSGAWKAMGNSKLWSVPYSLMSKDVSGALKKLKVTGTETSLDSALFEVKNNIGQTIFAVYNEGVRVYVDNGKKGTKGGFAVGGFGTTKAPSQSFLMVDPDSARIYVNEAAAKGNKGGFAIGGFTPGKGNTGEFMFLTPSNYFVGFESGKLVTTGVYNSTFGYQSGKNLTIGGNNVFVGYQSGMATNSGSSNIFVGTQTGFYNTSGYWNIILGRQAGYSNTTGYANIILGDWAGHTNLTGYQNVMIGDWAGGYNTTGFSNVFLGASAGNQNTTGSFNSFLGFNAGINNTVGQYNTYLGYKAGYSGASASGSNNIYVGVESGYSTTIGSDNIAIGNLAGHSVTDGTYNIMIGTSAGNLNVSGQYNAMIGYKSGEKTTANWNTMLGYMAGNANTTGGSQVMVGYTAGSGNTGAYNTIVGSVAGAQSGTGSFNTYIGLAAGEYATGNQNVFIGRWAGMSETTNSNKLIIENNYTGTDNLNNALVYGDFSTRNIRFNSQILATTSKAADYAGIFNNMGLTASNWGIKITCGTTDGSGINYPIDFYNASGGWEGSIMLNAGTLSLYNTSDKRLKQNIKKSDVDAVKILSSLDVVDYNYTKAPEKKHTGYIAQDVLSVIPEMVVYNEKEDTYAISQTTLIPYLHKAIVDQQKKIDQQEKRIQDLEALVQKLVNK
jgi:hypothetical protein